MSGDWMDGGGAVARRTNDVIRALLAQDFQKFTVSTLDDAIEHVADVHSDGAVKKYRKRVTTHGPFTSTSPGVWKVDR